MFKKTISRKEIFDIIQYINKICADASRCTEQVGSTKSVRFVADSYLQEHNSVDKQGSVTHKSSGLYLIPVCWGLVCPDISVSTFLSRIREKNIRTIRLCTYSLVRHRKAKEIVCMFCRTYVQVASSDFFFRN